MSLNLTMNVTLCCFLVDLVVLFVMIVQIEYPENVHLIRGNHEAADINALFGFRIECIERMVRMSMHMWVNYLFFPDKMC